MSLTTTAATRHGGKTDFLKAIEAGQNSNVEPVHNIALTKEGQHVHDIGWQMRPRLVFDEDGNLDRANSRHGRECLYIGGPGCGKSMVIRLLAAKLREEVKKSKFVSINASPGMKVDLLVGFPRPVPPPPDSAVPFTIDFQDGLLTQAVRNGWVFGFEEITRAPQEMLSRLYNLMDGGFAGWTVYENGEQAVKPHPGFWMLATANPTGAGLYTAPMDRALERRFKVKVEAEGRWVDEPKVLKGLLWDDENLSSRFMTFAEEVRKNEQLDWVMNTGTLIEMVKNITLGLSPMDAVKYTVTTRLPADDKANRDELAKHAGFFFDVDWTTANA